MADSSHNESTTKKLRKSFETTEEMRRLLEVVVTGGIAFRRLIYHPNDADPKEDKSGQNLKTWWNRLAHSSSSPTTSDTQPAEHQHSLSRDSIADRLWRLVDADVDIQVDYGIGRLRPIRPTESPTYDTRRATCQPVAEGILAAQSLLRNNSALLAHVMETKDIIAGQLANRKTLEGLETAAYLNAIEAPDMLRLLTDLARMDVRLLSDGRCSIHKLAVFMTADKAFPPDVERSYWTMPLFWTRAEDLNTKWQHLGQLEIDDIDLFQFWAPAPFVHWIQVVIALLADPVPPEVQARYNSNKTLTEKKRSLDHTSPISDSQNGRLDEDAAAAEILERRTRILAAVLYLWIDRVDEHHSSIATDSAWMPDVAELGRIALVTYMKHLHYRGYLGHFLNHKKHRQQVIDLMHSEPFLTTWRSHTNPPRFENDYAGKCVRRAVRAFYAECRKECRELDPALEAEFVSDDSTSDAVLGDGEVNQTSVGKRSRT